MNSAPIDVVYLWCDGSETNFISEKQKRLKQIGVEWNERNHGDIRYFDNDELRFSLRSVWKYLPWVNHIYLVTNKQRPKWLVDHPKITVVDHQEIIPEELLPTFNSVTIEMYLQNIPGLSEKFLYFNDDMFINAPLKQDFFFQNDKPVVRLIRDNLRWQFKSLERCEESLKESGLSSHRRSLLNAWYLYCSRRGISPFYVSSHTVDAFTKTLIKEVHQAFPELISQNKNPFRTDGDIQRVIFQLEMANNLGCSLREIQQLTFVQKHFGNLFKTDLDSYEGTESPKTWARIKKCKPKMFCINSSEVVTEEVKRKTRMLLEELFPEPSPFEG